MGRHIPRHCTLPYVGCGVRYLLFPLFPSCWWCYVDWVGGYYSPEFLTVDDVTRLAGYAARVVTLHSPAQFDLFTH